MGEKVIQQFYPQSAEQHALEGLYLGHNLRTFLSESQRSFVFTNYVVSLDGRIAIPHPTKPGMMVPKMIANPRDWRLFQELAIQADVLITSGRYLRDYADGRAQEILRVYDEPRFADLKAWREEQGLSSYPALAVVSSSLSFPVPEMLTSGDRVLLVYTDAKSDRGKRAALADKGARVIVAGEDGVDGRQLVDGLVKEGYRLIYNSTGPKVLHMLLSADVLDRLYLTHGHRILGAESFSTIVDGPLLDPPVDFKLTSAYYDPLALDGLGQLLVSYDRAR